MKTKEQFVSSTEPIPEAGCWLWMGAVLKPSKKDPTSGGYGICEWHGITRTAHRVSYELFRGPIPEDKQVLHTCDVRSCVNPNHLYLGTHEDNMNDRSARGRTAKGSQHGMFGRASRG